MGKTLLQFLFSITMVTGLLFGTAGRVAAQSAGAISFEEWLGLASPTKNMSFEQLLHSFGMRSDQGGETTATVLLWEEQEGGSFEYPERLSDNLEPGRGYFFYFYRSDDLNRGEERDFFSEAPATDEAPHDGVVEIQVSATDADESGRIDGMEGFNLLGNPFDRELTVGAIKKELATVSTNLNSYLYIWNSGLGNGNGGFELLNDEDVIAPVQAFWVRYLDDGIKGTVRFDRDRLSADDPRRSHHPVDIDAESFALKLGAGEWFDTYRIELRAEGEVGEDKLDGYKLFSLKSGAINLYSSVGGTNKLTRNVLPGKLEKEIEIPLFFSAAGKTDLSFSWEYPDKLPRNWDLILTDREMDREINLWTTSRYSFTLESADIEEEVTSPETPPEQQFLDTRNAPVITERFSLTIRPRGSNVQNETEILPESIRLKPNYPNPFTSTTTIPYELDESTEVTLTVWNMIGQKVATLVDSESQQAGRNHAENWNAASMPSGMYIARLEAGGEVFTRKMTLIK